MTGSTRIERRSAIDMSADEFRVAGHRLVELVAGFLESLPDRRIAPDDSASTLRAAIGMRNLPEEGADAASLLEQIAPLLFDRSLHNGHPRFFGYITSSAAPIGALADLLAAAVNPNVGLWELAPAASEIEAQTIRWLAELVGFPSGCGGLMVSGGNMANFLGFVAARRARAPWDVRQIGNGSAGQRLLAYASKETHTWIQKAADITGLGTDAIRWIDTDAQQRMRVDALQRQLDEDVASGHLPFIVVGTAGNVSTGAVDPLPALRDVANRYGLWLHVDGAYGAPAAALPDASPNLKALATADSVALDPHKWLYAPLEAACVLVRERAHLLDAFSYHPPYYHLAEEDDDAQSDGVTRAPRNDYYEHGMQNSRGFRALKVWLGLRQIGAAGLRGLIRGDIELAAQLFAAVEAHEEMEAYTNNLSITTFRYVPKDLRAGSQPHERIGPYLDELNAELLKRLKSGGNLYLSNAVLAGQYLLRACIVNFRTTAGDVAAVPGIVAKAGREADEALRPDELRRRAPMR